MCANFNQVMHNSILPMYIHIIINNDIIKIKYTSFYVNALNEAHLFGAQLQLCVIQKYAFDQRFYMHIKLKKGDYYISYFHTDIN